MIHVSLFVCITASFYLPMATSVHFEEEVVTRRQALDRAVDTEVRGWLCAQGDLPGAEAIDFDDSRWDIVDVGHKWLPHESICWFRKVIAIPPKIVGADVAGQRVRLKLGMDNGAEVFVDGKSAGRFAWWEGDVTIAESAEPGKRVVVAIRGINHPGYGQFLRADLVCDRSEPAVESLKGLLEHTDLVVGYMQPGDNDWVEAYSEALDAVDLDALERGDGEILVASVERAREILLTPTHKTPNRLKKVLSRLEVIKKKLEKAQELGLQAPYVRQKARVVESFITYSREDLATGDVWKSIRAARNAIFIEDLARKAEKDIRDILCTRRSEAEISFYRTGPSPIIDGVFTQQGNPIFFNGVGHFGQVRKDVPILNDYGFNMIQIEVGPSQIFSDPDVMDNHYFENQVLKVLDDAARHHVAVNLLISPHYFPNWAVEQHPELAECGYGFIRYCIEHAVARSIMERYLREIMPCLKNHPALHSICLSNEPQYRDRCEISLGRFRDWLRRRYSSIDEVNRQCHADFDSFGDIAIPENDTFSPLLYLYALFNQERFADWHRWMAEIIHGYDPDLRVHAKVMARAFEGPEEFLKGVDHEAFARLGAISGNDCWCQVPQKDMEPYEYAHSWINQAMYYDFQRSVAPGQPIVNSENHLIRDDDPIPVSGAHMYTSIWQGANHGQGGHAIWVWERGEGKTTSDNILTRAPCVEAAGRAGLDLLRCADEVARFVRRPADVAILFSWASTAPDHLHVEEIQKVYEGLYFCGVPIRFITERQCAERLLSEYQLVIVPRANHVKQSTVDSLSAYAGRGGAVVLVAPSLGCDELGRARQERARFPAKEKARVIDLPMTPRAYREVLGALLEQLGLSPPVVVQGPYGEPVWGVRWECVQDEGSLLVNLVNLAREPRRIRLRCRGSIGEWFDILSGRPVDDEFLLPSLQPKLLVGKQLR